MSDISLRGGFEVGPYKGYHGCAEFDQEVGEYHGRLSDTRDVITFVGQTPRELVTAFKESIDDYLEFCKSLGRSPDKPYSGNFPIRTTPEIHKAIAIAADREGKSLNQFVIDAAELAVAWTESTDSLAISTEPAYLPGPGAGPWFSGNPLSLDPATDMLPAYLLARSQSLQVDFGGRLAEVPNRVTLAIQSTTWKQP